MFSRPTTMPYAIMMQLLFFIGYFHVTGVFGCGISTHIEAGKHNTL
jgi:hypothetical protein